VILEQVKSILDKASLAVQAVFVFTLAAGIAVLFAAVQSTIDERRFESAMLRALGVLAAAGASILAAVVAVQLFELPYVFNPALWGAGLLGGIFLVCGSGYIAARGAINASPVEVLRAA